MEGRREGGIPGGLKEQRNKGEDYRAKPERVWNLPEGAV